jgi:hypothetical protein
MRIVSVQLSGFHSSQLQNPNNKAMHTNELQA